MRRSVLFWLLPLQVAAQLVPGGQPIPKTAKLPVVFMNGYEYDCSGSSVSTTFGIADQVLQANGEASVLFDTCSVAGKPSIEALGAAFSSFLNGLRYTDGTPVDQVDVIAHSMGGLVLRSYLAGKQDAPRSFTPPAVTHIRKAVLLATPNFGSPIGIIFGMDAQANELSSGSPFLFDLATWNQQNDDLRGIDVLAVAANGGTGQLTTAGYDDGVVPLSSASLGFVRKGRTRVLPYCHVDGGGLVSMAGLCAFDAKGIAHLVSADQDTARLITSFFNDTPDWQSIGTAAEQNPLLAANGGIDARARAADDSALNTAKATVSQGTTSAALQIANNDVSYIDKFSAGTVNVTLDAASRTYTLQPTVYQALVVKPGPNVARITPAAAATFPLVLAPRMIVSIYGDALANGIASATAQPLPTTLSDVQVSINGASLGLLYVSPTQINAVLPAATVGLVPLTIQNSAGKQVVNLWLEAAFPAVFTQNQSGSGLASVLNGLNQSTITTSNPLHAGDYAEIFLTGLGVASLGSNVHATVAIGGADCPVSYAGPAPGFTGLDQINCQVPSGVSASQPVPLMVTVGSRASNVVTVPVN